VGYFRACQPEGKPPGTVAARQNTAESTPPTPACCFETERVGEGSSVYQFADTLLRLHAMILNDILDRQTMEIDHFLNFGFR
jgi:hypothetical protein